MIQNANSLYKSPQLLKKNSLDLPSSNQNSSGASQFAKHLVQYAEGIKDTVQEAEKGMQAFALGETDSEKITPLVAAASVEVDALSKVVEGAKNAVNTLLNMSV